MNRICQLFGIQYPVIQGGMVWCSGWRLASAVSNAGGLGLIGAGSMHPEVLREHIRKCQSTTDKPFGVNVPLMYPEIDALMNILVEEGVKIVFTSAGNPKTWTGFLKGHGIKSPMSSAAPNLLSNVNKPVSMLSLLKVLKLAGITGEKRQRLFA